MPRLQELEIFWCEDFFGEGLTWGMKASYDVVYEC